MTTSDFFIVETSVLLISFANSFSQFVNEAIGVGIWHWAMRAYPNLVALSLSLLSCCPKEIVV